MMMRERATCVTAGLLCGSSVIDLVVVHKCQLLLKLYGRWAGPGCWSHIWVIAVRMIDRPLLPNTKLCGPRHTNKASTRLLCIKNKNHSAQTRPYCTAYAHNNNETHGDSR